MFALFISLHALLCFLPFAFSFSFTVSTLSECDDFTIEWTGGTGPYQLLISPPFGTQRNISIPTSAYANGRGSYSMQLPFAKDQEMVMTMSDATGFGTGGTTQMLTVEEQRGESQCSTTDPGVDFSYELNYALQQCREFTFEAFSRAVQPATVWVIVPGGKATSVPVPLGSRSFGWLASIPAGTSALFVMSDARGGRGGVSDLIRVGASDARGCLNDDALSSTFVSTSTSSSTPNPTTQLPVESSASSPSASALPSGIPISAIAGTVIGSLLFLAVIVTLGLFFLKNMKKKKDKAKEAKNADPFNYGSNPYGMPAGSSPFGPSSAHLQNPFADSAANIHALGPYPNTADPFQSRPYYPPSPHTPTSHASDPFNPSGLPVQPLVGMDEPPSPTEHSSTLRTATSGQQKASMAGVSSYKPTRFIVHDDAEDAIPPNADGVVELPPMYTERRAPSNFVLVNPDQPTPPRLTNT